MNKILKLEDFKANTKEWFLEQLGNMSASQALQTISDLYDELHKSQYPKTYAECCYVTSFENTELVFKDDYRDINPPKEQWERLGLMNQFNKLLICRDAYWKIAGEELGLGKPWKPVWDESEDLYTIHTFNGEIRLSGTAHRNAILVFPTEEMRDAFFDNFKDLIEKCKELL